MNDLRENDLNEQIKNGYNLLKEYETKLLYESDPKERAKFKREIDILNDDISQKQSQLYNLKKQQSNHSPSIFKTTPRSKPTILSVSRLPSTNSYLFGRKTEIKELNKAYEKSSINIVVLVAWGGVGKTAIVNHWIGELREHEYKDAQVVYAWSFYTQGVTERVVSSELFIETILKDFGDSDPTKGFPWEKGIRLANLIRKQKTLLIIDGLEPLQHPPGPEEGRLKDPAMTALLSELAEFNPGLCLITTRLKVANLIKFEANTVITKDLDNLDSKAGAEILRANGVIGRNEELEKTSIDFGGHALALTLLGSYLRIVHGGDISRRDRIVLLEDDTREGRHARRVMASYEQWLQEDPNSPDIFFLRLLSLFDRPADISALNYLFNDPPIIGLTDNLRQLSKTAIQHIVSRLRSTKLILEKNFDRSDIFDTHPLVREYFSERLQQERQSAWLEGNKRLSEHYQTNVPFQPDTIQEMEFLFQAAICGCKANAFRQVLDEIYKPRIMRGQESYAANSLGAANALLAVLSYFFELADWSKPVESLNDEDKLFVLIESGRYLTQIRGYAAPEVGQCYAKAKDLCNRDDSIMYLLEVTLGLCRFHRVRGELDKSQDLAEGTYILCEKIGNLDFMPLAYRALATNYYYMGNFSKANQYAQKGNVLYFNPQQAIQNAEFDINEPSISCLGYSALSLWFLGFQDQARNQCIQAVQQSIVLKHPHTLAITLLINAMVQQFCKDVIKVEKASQELIAHCTEHGFSLWRKAGEIMQLWSQALAGKNALKCRREMQRIIDEWQRTNAELFLPYWFGLLGEVCLVGKNTKAAHKAINMGLKFSSKNKEQWWEAELYRLKAKAFFLDNEPWNLIEGILNQAIMIANDQGAKSLILRILISIYKINLDRGINNKDTIELLKNSLNKFKEGQDTIDLEIAKNIIHSTL